MRKVLLFGLVFVIGVAVGWVAHRPARPAAGRGGPNALVSAPTPDGRRAITALEVVPAKTLDDPDWWYIEIAGVGYYCAPRR